MEKFSFLIPIICLALLALPGAVIIYGQGRSAKLRQCEEQLRPDGASDSDNSPEKGAAKARTTPSGAIIPSMTSGSSDGGDGGGGC